MKPGFLAARFESQHRRSLSHHHRRRVETLVPEAMVPAGVHVETIVSGPTGEQTDFELSRTLVSPNLVGP